MIGFLAKGLARDRSRSLFPILVITLGVAVCVLLDAYIGGALEMFNDTNARFQTGHVKIETREAVSENQKGLVDLALLNNEEILANLAEEVPQMEFYERIYLGALVDVPDEKGETRAQSSCFAIAVNLIGEKNEIEIMKLDQSLVSGRFPQATNEILMAERFRKNMGVKLGDSVTLIGSDMDGGMAVSNFVVVGSLRFGVLSMDKSAMIMDLDGARELLTMPDGATEILGFYKDRHYTYHRSEGIKNAFNERYSDPGDPFSPQMRMLEEQSDLESMLVIFYAYMDVVVVIFTFIMSIVLWNTGLMSGIRRYAEMGVRLAMGETKTHVYLSLIVEGFLIGLVGAVFGTALGLIPAYFLQEVGIDVSEMMKGEMSMMMEDRLTAQITLQTYLAGIVPGVMAPFLGSIISGLVIFRRDTSRLFVELEV